MTDDFAVRATTALQAVPHTTGCSALIWSVENMGQLTGDKCDCDREDRIGALVARAILATADDRFDLHNDAGHPEKPITVAVNAGRVAAALRVLTGEPGDRVGGGGAPPEPTCKTCNDKKVICTNVAHCPDCGAPPEDPPSPKCDHCERPMRLIWACMGWAEVDSHPLIWRDAVARGGTP